MNSMNLKDFRPDIPDFDEESDTPASALEASTYHEGINTLKIEKLSNRVTIISIILPCLIGAILFYAYLDIKERMVDVDQTKQNQVETIAQQLEEKINALDVKIAKNRFDLDTTLPELDKKNISLEGQITKFADAKADSKTINDQFTKLEKRVADNTTHNKTSVQTIEKLNKEIQTQFDKNLQHVKNEINIFKEKFDARLVELSGYEQQIGELRKDFSLLDKKFKRVEQDNISQAKVDEKILQLKTDLTNHLVKLDKQVETLNQKLITNISRLQKDLDLLMKTSSADPIPPKTSIPVKPKPQINIDSSSPVIEQTPLTQ